MRKFLSFVNKNKIAMGVITFVILSVFVITKVGSSYALDSKIYTRKQMQEMVVSTGLSLYYNSYFSDYGQKTLDSLGITGNYYNYGNVFWRDLNIIPEDVGYSKYYHVDCSAYNFLIYKNTFGYEMSEYNTVNTYPLFYQTGYNNRMVRVSYFTGEKRLARYRDAYSRFGYGWNSNYLGRVSRDISGNCASDDANCTNGLNENAGKAFVYNNLDNKQKNELAYYYAANGVRSKDTVIKAWNDIKGKLQPGDIIKYTRYKTSAADTSGHVMFYVGDDITTSSNGESGFTDMLLHSTGNDYQNSKEHQLNRLRKTNSILLASADNYVNERFEKVFEQGYLVDFAIFRPINTMCTDDNTCKINNNDFNVSLTDAQLKNNEARVALKKNQVQQYMRIDKKFTYMEEMTTKNILGDYSSVNIGDQVTYKLRIRNKLDNVKTTGLTITAEIPTNGSYVSGSCSSGCSVSGNTLTWNNVSIEGENTYKDIVFKVEMKKEGTVTFNGYKITTPVKGKLESETLQMTKKDLDVYPTHNGVDRALLEDYVYLFEELVKDGKIEYISSGDHSTNLTKLDDLFNSDKKISVSGLGFIKMMYYNAFGLDLDEINDEEDIMNSANIRNAVFTQMSYPEKNNLLSGSPAYTGDTTAKVFARKLEGDTAELTGVQSNIAKMVVPGLYGGKHLKGNDLGDRVKFLRSFVNNSAYQSDLEIGDIIISYADNLETFRCYLYIGDDKYGPVLVRFTRTDSEGAPLFLRHTDQYLSTYYNTSSLWNATKNKPSNQILNELFSKDLFVVLRPSRLGTTITYDYNGGSGDATNSVAYNTYNYFPDAYKVRGKSYELILNYDKYVGATYPDKLYDDKYFMGWTADKETEDILDIGDALNSNKNHTLYAVYGEQEYQLPRPEYPGYTFEGWYKDAALTNKVTDSEMENYIINYDHTLYAKWIGNEYEVKYDANGGTGTMANSKFRYGSTGKLSSNTYTKEGYVFDGWSLTSGGSIKYLDGQSVKDLTDNTDSVTLYAVWREFIDTDVSVGVEVKNGTSSQVTKVVTKGSDAIFDITNDIGYDNGTVSCTNGQKATLSDGGLIVNSVTSSTVCNVEFVPNTYTIKFDSNGGNGTMNDITVKYDEKIKLSKNLFTKNGYSFEGWKTNSESYIEYLDEEYVINLTNDSEVVTLMAVWEMEPYWIDYDLNDGNFDGEVYPPEIYYVDEEIIISNPVKEGFEFLGWTGSNGDTPKVDLVLPIGTYGDKQFVANWGKSKYKINYVSDNNGKITGITTEDIASGGSPSGTTWDINSGYKHLKWAADVDVELSDGRVILAGDDLTMNDIKKVVVNNNITFTTYHYVTKVVINYESSDNGVISGIVSEDVSKNSTVLGSNVTPSVGYEFSHWICDKDVTLSDSTTIKAGEAINDEQLVKVVATEELIFTAMYKVRSYHLTYTSDKNGEISGISSEDKNYKDKPSGSSTKPIVEHMFGYWTANYDVTLEDGTLIAKGNPITNEQLTKVLVDNDITFTAVHIRKELIVIYKGIDGIVINGNDKEIVKYGANPLGVSVKSNSETRKVVYIADKDIILKDGTKISAGKEITAEQLKLIVVNDDLTITAKYAKEEIVTNIPDTGRIQSVISVIGGLFLVVIGITLVYGTTYKKRFN